MVLMLTIYILNLFQTKRVKDTIRLSIKSRRYMKKEKKKTKKKQTSRQADKNIMLRTRIINQILDLSKMMLYFYCFDK